MDCKKLNKHELTDLGLKLGLSKLEIKTTKNLCDKIQKIYNKKYPCNNIINKETQLKIKKHQINIANELIHSRGVVVFHKVGTGKTLSAIITSRCLLANKIIKKIIVITPTSLQENFKKELLKYNENIDMNDYIFYTIQGITNAIKNKTVESCKDCLVMIDEAHNLRTLDSVRYKEIYKYCLKAKKILLLSATPLINSKYDIINLVSLIRGEEQITEDEFDKIEKNKTLLKKYLDGIFNVYLKSNEKHYPNKKIIEIFMVMSDKYLEDYNKIERGEVNKIPVFKDKNVAVFYNGVRRASNVLDKKSPKFEWIKDKILDNPKSKFVIFSHFLTMGLKPIMKELDDNNIKYSYITGDISMNERKNSVNLYNSNEVKILFISKSGAEGLDLKGTNYIIIIEPSWNENEVEQIIGRGVRYKSHENFKNKSVTVYRLYLIKPIEEQHLKEITDELLLDYNDEKLSVDLYLRNYSLLKQREIESFYDTIIKMQ